MLVTKKDFAIALSYYCETSESDFFLSHSEIDRSSKSSEVESFLKASAEIIRRKKNWFIKNENGDVVKFVKTMSSRNRERDSDGDLTESWMVQLESEWQHVHADMEYNHSTECLKRYSNFGISEKQLSDDSDK